MKVIFNKDLKGQGKKGEVKEVSDGYATNFLIPKGYAVPANTPNINLFEAEKNKEISKKNKEKEQAIALKEKLESITLQIKIKIGENGELFGSITNKQITDALKNETGIELDRKKVILESPIKATGITKVQVKVYPDLAAELKVNVIEG